MITLDGDIASKLGSGMSTSGAIELPFPAPVLWVVNGNASLKQVGGAQYFGGWAGKTEDFEAASPLWAGHNPAGFTASTIITQDNKEIESLTARGVFVAPIGVRSAWVNPDGVRYADYVQGARQHVQALCYLAEKVDGKLHPWGPVVLTAKGFQAKNLLGTFGAWDKHTVSARRKCAPNIPAWCFYLAIGTFGAERKSVMVGNGKQSAITPISAYLPPEVSEETLLSLFVGQDVASQMADMLSDAKEWLSAWKTTRQDVFKTNEGQSIDPALEVPVHPEDEIPF